MAEASDRRCIHGRHKAQCACSSAPERGGRERTTATIASLQLFPKFVADADLAEGRLGDALTLAQQVLATSPNDCGANYVALIAETMLVVDSINTFILPYERALPATTPIDHRLAAGTRPFTSATLPAARTFPSRTA
jgi:hypothetical protein